ncbi:MAG: hypothetical protein ACKOJH_00460 [Actinomycetota bacterium]
MTHRLVAREVARRLQLDALFPESERDTEQSSTESVDPNVTQPYPPVWDDLSRLFALCRLRRVTTVLEFGCGFSSVVLAHALSLNSRDHGGSVRAELRRGNAFELHVVDDMQQYLGITKQRLSRELLQFVTFHHTTVAMTTFQDRIATQYEALPNICPDFIYLDGPSQDSAVGDVHGISTRHTDRLPMACDILKMEHFLLPGTLILVDGRTANARFLKTNLQREWRYEHDVDGDVHYFEMIEEPLGKWNRRQIEFCLGPDWRAKPLKPDYSKLVS